MTRITNAMLTNNYLSDMQTNLSNMSTLQNQLSSGKNINKGSDDPLAANKIMNLNYELSANTQYSTNINDANNWLNTTDTALGEAGNALSRIRQLMVQAGNGSYGTDELSSIKDEVTSTVQELGETLNTSFDGNYIFGGTKSTSKPVTVDDNGKMSYADADGNAINENSDGSTTVTLASNNIIENGTSTLGINSITKDSTGSTITIGYTDGTTASTTATNLSTTLTSAGFSTSDATNVNSLLTQAGTTVTQIGSGLKTEISQGIIVNYNQTAAGLLQFNDGSTSVNTMNVLQNILSDLGTLSSSSSTDTDKNTAVSDLNGTSLNQLDSVINNFLQGRSEVGTMENRMTSVSTTNSDQNNNMTSILSNAQDVDVTEKTVEYSSAQAVYTAALQVSSQVLTKTLMDYLT